MTTSIKKMKTPEQWRHEAYVAVHSDDAFTVDSFIREVQRDAFDAGAAEMHRACGAPLDYPSELAKRLPGRP